MNNIIEVKDLNYRYPSGEAALSGISFAVRAGESLAIIGPNGAGKSTLLMHLNGTLMPNGHGKVTVGGKAVNAQNLFWARRSVGLVFQNPDDQLFMPTVREDVAFGPLNLGLTLEEVNRRVSLALEQTGMQGTEGRLPHHLSIGEKKRISIATVLAMQPQILALDEPTSNLDPGGRRELLDLLGRLPAAKIVATHDLEFALALCPRCILLKQGYLLADGPIREILTDESLMARAGLEVPWSLRYKMKGER